MDAGRNSNVLLESGRYAVRSVEKMVRFCVSSSNEVRFGLCNFVSLGVLHYARGEGDTDGRCAIFLRKSKMSVEGNQNLTREVILFFVFLGFGQFLSVCESFFKQKGVSRWWWWWWLVFFSRAVRWLAVTTTLVCSRL